MPGTVLSPHHLFISSFHPHYNQGKHYYWHYPQFTLEATRTQRIIRGRIGCWTKDPFNIRATESLLRLDVCMCPSMRRGICVHTETRAAGGWGEKGNQKPSMTPHSSPNEVQTPSSSKFKGFHKIAQTHIPNHSPLCIHIDHSWTSLERTSQLQAATPPFVKPSRDALLSTIMKF